MPHCFFSFVENSDKRCTIMESPLYAWNGMIGSGEVKYKEMECCLPPVKIDGALCIKRKYLFSSHIYCEALTIFLLLLDVENNLYVCCLCSTKYQKFSAELLITIVL